jgi:hypothetical protein
MNVIKLTVPSLLTLAFATTLHASPKETGLVEVKGPYRVELEVLPPEPFHAAGETQPKEKGPVMLAVGGAAPVALDSTPPPNHHLVVHVFNEKTGKVEPNERVVMSLQRLDDTDQPIGNPVRIPVVVMQVVGKGAASTHYGNNVRLLPGAYRVMVNVNGEMLTFTIREGLKKRL